MHKNYEKYRGASFRRGDDRNKITLQNVPAPGNIFANYNILSESNSDVFLPDNINNTNSDRIISSDILLSDTQEQQPQQSHAPVDQNIYEFIKLFGDLYPTLIGLMGGTEIFPPESLEITCDSIPANYDELMSLPEYLWRFNDFSYCKFLEYLGSRQISMIINAKINARAKYLQLI